MFDSAGGDVGVVYQRTYEMLRRESDRGAALLAGVLLEGALDGLLAKHMRALPKNKQPRREFAGKIDLAYQVFGIDESMYEGLHAIRVARNGFAHKLVSDMNDEELRRQFSNLFKSVLEIYPNLMAQWIDGINAISEKNGSDHIVHDASDLSIRYRFDNLVTILVADLYKESLPTKLNPSQATQTP